MSKSSAFAKYALILITLTVNLSCDSQKSGKVELLELSEPPVVSAVFTKAQDASYGNTQYETVQEIPEQTTLPANPEQRIIRRATLRFQVADFKKSREVIQQVIPMYQAQIYY